MEGAVSVLPEPPKLARNILIRLQVSEVVPRPAIKHIELHSGTTELGAQLVVEVSRS